MSLLQPTFILTSVNASSTLVSVNRVTTKAAYPLYGEALDFLNRAKVEGKDNEVTLELFHLLYGDELAAKFIAEGYFTSESN